jgi:hypothetical protein
MSSDNSEENSEVTEDVTIAKKKGVVGQPIEVKITNQTSLDQQKLWDELRTSIKDEYSELNIPFDPSSITTKEEMEHHVAVLKRLKNAKEEFQKENSRTGAFGTPITGKEMGDYQESTSDRPIEQLKENTKDFGDLELFPFHSEKEMRDVINAIANDSSDSRHLEARKLQAKLLQSQNDKSQTLELEGSLKEALHGKAKFRKKGKSED